MGEWSDRWRVPVAGLASHLCAPWGIVVLLALSWFVLATGYVLQQHAAGLMGALPWIGLGSAALLLAAVAALLCMRARVRANSVASTVGLQACEAHFGALASVTDQAIVTVDERGRVVYANAATERLFGHAVPALIGRSALRLVPAGDRARCLKIWAVLLAADPEETIGMVREVRARHRHGSTFAVELTSAKWAAGTHLRVTFVVRAHTAQQSADLDTVTHSISHDLRAPLRHINGHVAMLLADAPRLDGQQRERLRRIADTALRLGSLIDELLRFARLGKVALHKRPLAMGELVARARTIHAYEVAGRSVEWEVGLLPTVEGDPDLLQQVWVELLANALRFTRMRAVTRIVVRAEQRGDEWVFMVRDNGVGFDPQRAKHLYDVFEQLREDDRAEGTGIGLANVRRIVERHGGQVWATGAVDAGASFYFTLPVTV